MGTFNPDKFLGGSVAKKTKKFDPDAFIGKPEVKSAPTEGPSFVQKAYNLAKHPAGPLGIINPLSTAISVAEGVQSVMRERAAGKPTAGQGGYIDREVLSGQLPMQGAILGGTALNVPGAVIGGGAGKIAEKVGRYYAGLDEAPKNIMEPIVDVGLEAAKQGAYAYGGQKAGKYYGKASKFVKDNIASRQIPNRVRGFFEDLPLGVGGFIKGGRLTNEANALASFKSAESTRKVAYQNSKADVKSDIKGMGAKTRVDAASGLKESVQQADDAINVELNKAKGAVKKYNNERVSVERVRKKIVDELGKQGVKTDASGNFIDDAFVDAMPAEKRASQKYLREASRLLQQNPTIENLDRVRTSFGEAADFDGISRSTTDKAYARVYRESRLALLDGLESSAKSAGAKADVARFAKAKANYAKKSKMVGELSKITDNPPETIADRARSQLKGSNIKTWIKTDPTLKEPIKDVVVNDLIKRSSNAKQFTEAIDYYGRDTLKGLMPKKTFDALMSLESRLQQASTPFVANKMPQKPLGKFWEAIKTSAGKGAKIDPEKARLFFQAVGNTLEIKSTKDSKRNKWGPI